MRTNNTLSRLVMKRSVHINLRVAPRDDVLTWSQWDGLHGVITKLPDTTDARDAMDYYAELRQVNHCFRVTQHSLKIRPFFYWTPTRKNIENYKRYRTDNSVTQIYEVLDMSPRFENSESEVLRLVNQVEPYEQFLDMWAGEDWWVDHDRKL